MSSSIDYFEAYVKENFNEVLLGTEAWIERLEGNPQEGDQYITTESSCYIYFKYHNKQWCPYTKIPEKVLATLLLAHPEVYAQIANTFKL